jgi:hypothetical protein
MSDTRNTANSQETYNYQRLRELAVELNRPLATLIALADDNDPYFAGRPGRRLDGARWFADLWQRLDIPHGVHLRRLHYLLVSTTAIVLPDGKPYENSHECWKRLGSTSADARYLDLVPAEAFVDRRAPEPIVYIPADDSRNALIGVHRDEPSIVGKSTGLLLDYEPRPSTFPELPNVYFVPPKLAEPYAIEIWVEKSTVNDILLPLAQARGVTLVTGVGELSITACLAVVRRVRDHRRATRILYISDFDPAGQGMPTSVARKIQYFLDRDGDDLDIKLFPILLTAEQVAEFNLPRIPIKESDRRRGVFEAKHGEGAVELDALVALHPGTLERLVRQAIDRYRAPKREAEREIALLELRLRRDIQQIRENVLAAHADELAELRTGFERTQTAIAERQAVIAEALVACRRTIEEQEEAIDELLGQWSGGAAPVWEAIAGELEDNLPDLDEIEWPEPERPDDDHALFDSERDYVEQVDAFKRHQGKRTARRERLRLIRRR